MIILTENKSVKEVAGIQKGIGARGLLPILDRLDGKEIVYYQLIFGRNGSHMNMAGRHNNSLLRVSPGHITVGNDLRVEFNDIIKGDVGVDNSGSITKITIYTGTSVALELFF
jgi:hypothetical protein